MGEDVKCSMWWHRRNCASSSDKKGCPLTAGMVACTEISALAGVHTKTGWTWLLPLQEGVLAEQVTDE